MTHSGAAPNQVCELTSVLPTTPAMPLAENTGGYTPSLLLLLLRVLLLLALEPICQYVCAAATSMAKSKREKSRTYKTEEDKALRATIRWIK